jgi:hypothetical protein
VRLPQCALQMQHDGCALHMNQLAADCAWLGSSSRDSTLHRMQCCAHRRHWHTAVYRAAMAHLDLRAATSAGPCSFAPCTTSALLPAYSAVLLLCRKAELGEVVKLGGMCRCRVLLANACTEVWHPLDMCRPTAAFATSCVQGSSAAGWQQGCRPCAAVSASGQRACVRGVLDGHGAMSVSTSINVCAELIVSIAHECVQSDKRCPMLRAH